MVRILVIEITEKNRGGLKPKDVLYHGQEGSSYSAYTPLWFAVSNGYTDLVKLILNYNASASIVDKTPKKSNVNLNNGNDINVLIQNEDHIGIRRRRERAESDINSEHMRSNQQQTSYLFSPLRASIVYSRFQIMIHLLEYGANVYELFGATFNGEEEEESQKSTYNEDYVNALKLLHRQFGPFLSQNLSEYDQCLNKLNEFIASPNVYRRMLIEFVKNVYTKVASNQVLASQLNLNLNVATSTAFETNKNNSLEYIKMYTEYFENKANMEGGDEWTDYLNTACDFCVSIDVLLNPKNEQTTNPILSENTQAANQLSRKPLFHQNLFEFSKLLMEKFFVPKTLKELCRFRLRKFVLNKIQKDKCKYNKAFTKRDHQVEILKTFDLPNNLIDYLVHSN